MRLSVVQWSFVQYRAVQQSLTQLRAGAGQQFPVIPATVERAGAHLEAETGKTGLQVGTLQGWPEQTSALWNLSELFFALNVV